MLSWEAQAAYRDSMRSSGLAPLSGAGVVPQQTETAVLNEWGRDLESLALPMLPPTNLPQLTAFGPTDYYAPISASYTQENNVGVVAVPAAHGGALAFPQPADHSAAAEYPGLHPQFRLFETYPPQSSLLPSSAGTFPSAGTWTEPTSWQAGLLENPGLYTPDPTPIIPLEMQLYHLRDLLRARQITPDETLQIALQKPSEELAKTIEHLDGYLQIFIASLPLDSESPMASSNLDLDQDRRLLRLLKTGRCRLTAELARRQGRQERDSPAGTDSRSVSRVTSDSDDVMSPGTSTE